MPKIIVKKKPVQHSDPQFPCGARRLKFFKKGEWLYHKNIFARFIGDQEIYDGRIPNWWVGVRHVKTGKFMELTGRAATLLWNYLARKNRRVWLARKKARLGIK